MNPNFQRCVAFTALAMSILACYRAAPVRAAEGTAEEAAGRFILVYHAGESYDESFPWRARRVRVSDVNAASGVWGERDETWSNGLLAVHLDRDQDMSHLKRAELYVDYWGGHPGTINKRVTINGRSTYPLPERGCAIGLLTHGYDFIPINLTDLVREDNALQFNCDEGDSFWGHFIVNSAQLWIEPNEQHPIFEDEAIASFKPEVKVEPVDGQEAYLLSVDIPKSLADKVESVEFWGRFHGYDESGRGHSNVWHGGYRGDEPFSHIGLASGDDPQAVWDLSMVPDQTDMAVIARVRFKSPSRLVYETKPVEGIATPDRPGVGVQLFSQDHHRPSVWVRLHNDGPAVAHRHITTKLNPDWIERAQLHWTDWDGGKGEVDVPYHFNGHALPVDSDAHHISRYHVVEVDPDRIVNGTNVWQVSAHTDHHGIEILKPGPALIIRYKTGVGE